MDDGYFAIVPDFVDIPSHIPNFKGKEETNNKNNHLIYILEHKNLIQTILKNSN